MYCIDEHDWQQGKREIFHNKLPTKPTSKPDVVLVITVFADPTENRTIAIKPNKDTHNLI